MESPHAPTNGSFRVDDGEIFFQCAGDGKPVVFLHGFGLDQRMWAPQFEAFRSMFRVIRYDLRGFGRSSLPNAAYSHEDDLKALLSHLGATPAHVVGVSMGGRMALRFAATYPQLVSSLVLADSALDGYAWSVDWQKRWDEMCQAARGGQVAEARRRWLEHPLFDSARSNPFAGSLLARMIEDYSGWHWHNRDAARVPVPPLAKRLDEIHVPSLVITGERDLSDFQAIAEVLGRGLHRVQRAVIEGAGHMVNVEAPRDFNAALQAFWQT